MVIREEGERLAHGSAWVRGKQITHGRRAVVILIGAVASADVLVWDHTLGLGLAIWFALSGLAAVLAFRGRPQKRTALLASCIALAALLPIVEVAQFGTIVVGFLGLLVAILLYAGVDAAGLARALWRLPFAGLLQTIKDALGLRINTPSRDDISGVMADWVLPVGVGGVFVVLIATANPLIDGWLTALTDPDLAFLPRLERVIFWGWIACFIWPLLRLQTLLVRVTQARAGAASTWRSGFVNARSVARALILFNLIFAFQTVMDFGFLWVGQALPEGMSYAEYAHRGAYPLLATVLMAGSFALLAQPYLGSGRLLRWLLYLWVGQTVLLVISAYLRLDLYVDAYGLTRLRFAAFVWIGVVALGLLLLMRQIQAGQSVRWFFMRASCVAFAAIYLCNLINIDGFIARHNLAMNLPDHFYLCRLSEGAVPAIWVYQAQTGEEVCPSTRPGLSHPTDWREWGFRNARLRNSVAQMEAGQ